MKHVNPRRVSAAELEAMTRRDRNRIVMMALAALLLGAGWFWARIQRTAAQREDEVRGPQVGEAPAEDLIVPEFDQPELLGEVRDTTPEERLTLSGEALTALLYYSNVVTPRHFAALGIEDVDSAVVQRLAQAPGPERGRPFEVRGVLEELGRRRRTEKLEESYGTVRLDDGGHAHLAFVKPAEDDGLQVGDFVHLEGMFVQNYRGAVKGELIDAPLFAGRTIERSYPRCDAPDADALRKQLIAEVRDDQVDDVQADPRDALWNLMAFARQRAGEVDWEKDAVLVDNTTLMGLIQGGDAFRGVPFRFPVSLNVGTWTSDAGENCLRLDDVTQGWIGNSTWKATPVVKWIAPFDAPELAERYGHARYVEARGFFLRNIFYEKQNGEPGRAPLFVMAAVDTFAPPVDPRPRQLMMGVLAGTVGIVGLFWFLLRRDRKAAAKLHEDLVRRRQARRRQDSLSVAADNGPSTTA